LASENYNNSSLKEVWERNPANGTKLAFLPTSDEPQTLHIKYLSLKRYLSELDGFQLRFPSRASRIPTRDERRLQPRKRAGAAPPLPSTAAGRWQRGRRARHPGTILLYGQLYIKLNHFIPVRILVQLKGIECYFCALSDFEFLTPLTAEV